MPWMGVEVDHRPVGGRDDQASVLSYEADTESEAAAENRLRGLSEHEG